MITHARIMDLLMYCRETGEFHWRINRGRTAKAGQRAGTERDDGYREIKVDGTAYLEHRLAWFYITGCWPNPECDHRNLKKADNRWDNLRVVTRSSNMQNMAAARADNKTGFLGVSPHGKKFRAQIYIEGKRVTLGSHETPEQAHAAYLTEKRKIHEKGTL